VIQADGQAPYAPPATVMHVIDRHRQVAIPRFDVATLERVGVSKSLAPRTAQTLRLLGLIDEEGNPTAVFEELRKSSTPDFQPTLARIVREAYKPVFDILDPTNASTSEIEDSFRHFTPAGQRGRMVTLFIGLLDGAGLRDGALKKEPTARRRVPVPPRKVSQSDNVVPALSQANELSVEPSKATRYDEGDTYRIQLNSGGSVSVVMDVNLFRMSSEDREFVIDLVDRLKNYQSAEDT